MKFRKKSAVVEAIRYDGNEFEVAAWIGGACYGSYARADGLVIHTTEGPMLVRTGDWIIKGPEGAFFSCSPTAFEAIYEPANEGS